MASKKVKTNYISDDLKFSRRFNVKVKTLNVYQPNVVEIVLSFIAIPKDDLTQNVYNSSIERIKKTYFNECTKYIKNNRDVFRKECIMDFNFSSANLKKGYNKIVSMSLVLRQNGTLSFRKIKSYIRKTFRASAKCVVDMCREESFKCCKAKLKPNCSKCENH